MRWRHRAAAVLCALWGGAPGALAEVADKMPAVSAIWSSAVPSALAAYLCARIKPALGVAAMAVAVFFSTGRGIWKLDRQLDGAVADEMGAAYLYHAYLAIALPLLFGLLGILHHTLLRRRVNRSGANT